MKAIMVMFDSLNRRLLPPYGCDWVKAPNFSRLAENSVTFDNCFAGSMACIPARRELHTGRYNFLHRTWGPIEPFDDSMPEMLNNNGVYSHLISDHYHYWEDGGCTYHTRYSSWELSRGQESDPWKADIATSRKPDKIDHEGGPSLLRNHINRSYMEKEEEHSQAKTFRLGMEFIEKNHEQDNWFLHIETFDPHEPFFSPDKYHDLYLHEYAGEDLDWPSYSQVKESEETVEHVRNNYASLVSMCDTYLGKILDMMDRYSLWEDTMLIVNTDHGYMLGEHNWWAKVVQPFYNEIVHIPLFIWDPRVKIKNERRRSLVQTIDLGPTLLDFFSLPLTADMQGVPLAETIAEDKEVRDAALFGMHGAHVNCTDGRYVYMRAPEDESNQPLFNYTLMPTEHGTGRAFLPMEELETIDLSAPFPFTKGLKTMKIRSGGFHGRKYHQYGNLLFDIEKDYAQNNPLTDRDVEHRMISKMIELMKTNDTPREQFERLGLNTH